MYDKIMIGEKELEMAASAATPVYFGKVFKGRKLLEEMSPLFSGKVEPVARFDLLNELAFVMAMRAKIGNKGFKEVNAEMEKLKESDYIEWLEQFDMGEMLLAVEKILEIYLGNMKQNSIPKK